MDRILREEYVFGVILLLANKLQNWGDHLFDELTLKQWFFLMLLTKIGIENPTIKEISEFTGTTRQNVKKMLIQLEKRGFVTMKSSPKDARALNVYISKRTLEFFSGNKNKGVDTLSLLFKQVTDEELRLTFKTLNKLLIAMENSK